MMPAKELQPRGGPFDPLGGVNEPPARPPWRVESARAMNGKLLAAAVFAAASLAAPLAAAAYRPT